MNLVVAVSMQLIRIEPDWNVKAGIYETQGESWAIRIEPDWNVKRAVL